ncbi:MAG: YicC/YloC family endoribonuclease, partial [Pseudomonadota bacterium]
FKGLGQRQLSSFLGLLHTPAIQALYLEVSVRLPEELRAIEMAAREKIGKRIKRGKIECTLRYKPSEVVREIEVNDQIADALIAACTQIAKRTGSASAPSAIDVLRWPGVVSQQESDFGAVQTAATALLGETIGDFVATREREGAATAGMIAERCDGIAQIVAQLREHRPSIVQRLRERLQQKLDELNAEVDQQRVEQELVIAAQKLDVDEELDRLDAHVAEVSNVLQRDEPIGRRLDFLMQELNREANTLGSKSQDKDTTALSVDLKVLIEQMREQVQNLE